MLMLTVPAFSMRLGAADYGTDPTTTTTTTHRAYELLVSGFGPGFSGPLELKKRLGTLEAAQIAATDASRLEAAFRERPAIHRFPGNMARRVQELAAAIATQYGNDPRRVWAEAKDAKDLEQRLLTLPGIGAMKAANLVSILARRFGVRPEGWEALAPKFPTLGDVDSPEALATYRAGKAAWKAELREKSTP